MKCTTETIFTRDEEVEIVEHAEDSARLGCVFSVTEIQREAGRIAHTLGRRDSPKPLSINWVVWFSKTLGVSQTIGVGHIQGRELYARECCCLIYHTRDDHDQARPPQQTTVYF